jgi:hypothetical protein
VSYAPTIQGVSWWKRSLFLGLGVLLVAVVLTVYVISEGNKADTFSSITDSLSSNLSEDALEASNARNRDSYIRVGRMASVTQGLWATGFGLVVIGGGLKITGFDRPRCPHCQTRVHPEAQVCKSCGRDQ